MSSYSDSFWTKTSGIATIVGLVFGGLLTVVTLWFTILSYRQMNKKESSERLYTTSFSNEPSPPYILVPKIQFLEEGDTKKLNSLTSSTTFKDITTGNNEFENETSAESRKGRFGHKRLFIVFLVTAIMLAGGVIGLAANISRIQKMR